VDPGNGRIVYLVTDNGSVYRSDNGGQAWSNLWTDPKADQGIDTLVVDGSRSSTLFAAGQDGIFRSTNEGAQWQQVDAHDVGALAVDPANPDMAYAGGSQKILQTSDGGITWHDPHAFPATRSVEVRSLTVDPRRPDTVIAGLYSAFIYRSVNGGTTWRSADYPGRQLGPLVFDPVQGNWALGSSENGSSLYVTYDDGADWQPVAAHFSGVVQCLAASARMSP
jgi:photosystem II stability/assembly factor-like uncharacterized protein